MFSSESMRGSSGPRWAPPPEHDVERAAAAMTRVSVADGGDLAGVAGGGEPVPDRGPDRAALPGPVRWRFAGDEQEQPSAAADRLLELPIDQVVGGGKVVAMQIEAQIGLDEPA